MDNFFPRPSPGEKSSSSWAYDSIHDVIVLFGGVLGSGQTWIFNLTTDTWEEKFPLISPPARAVTTMTFDSKNGVVVLFGGYTIGHGTELDDTWVYDVELNTWRELDSPARPPHRHWAGLAYDIESSVGILSIFSEESMSICHDLLYTTMKPIGAYN